MSGSGEARPDWLDLIGDARFVFWTCPNDAHRMVTWTTNDDGTMTPRCDECGKSGAAR